MAVKSFNPVTPSRRHMAVLDYAAVITTDKPEKSLVKGKKSSGGRNNYGRTTTRFRGAGNKRRYRMIDFVRAKEGVPAKVVSIEYDPNRTANIALLSYADGEKAYILAPVGLKVGDVVMNGPKAELKPGNSMKLRDIPVGINICCIELQPGNGAKLVRSAGQVATLRGKEETYAQIKLPSRGSPDAASELPRDDRADRQPGTDERQARQGRQEALYGLPSACPRRGDEPGRPSDGRRRRPHFRRRPSGFAVGRAG